MVTKESLRNVAWGCLYRVNNCLDHEFRPRPVNEIINSAKKMVGVKKAYAVISDNSQRFVTDLRYGWPRCKMSDEDPIPGDMIEVDRKLYQHWAIYVGDGFVVHVTTPGSGSFSYSKGEVKCEPLKDVLQKNSYVVHNYLDNVYRPRPVDEIVNLAKQKIGETWHYNLLMSNCEHFATEMRYDLPQSRQVKNGMPKVLNFLTIPARVLI